MAWKTESMQNKDVYKFCMTKHVSLASLTGWTEVETRPGVSSRLCHAESQDSENVKKKYLLYLRSIVSF